MIVKISIIAAGVLLLLAQGASDAYKPPKTVKQAVLGAIDLSGGQRVFGQDGKKDAKKRMTSYLLVEIRGTKLVDGSIKVVFSLPHPRRKSETTDVFTVEFSTTGIKTRPVRPVSVTPGQIPKHEDIICNAVKAVMAKYLSKEEPEVSVSVCVISKGQKVSVVVSKIPSVIGHSRLFIVNEKNKIERVIIGR